MSPKQLSSLLESSRQVIADCVLSNGAIVAANSKKAYFPKSAKGYRYVWPRDAYFILKASRVLKMPQADQIAEGFFSWCKGAEGWKESGLFYENYHPSGKRYRKHFQPDQTGSVLLALHDFCKNDPARIKKYHSFITKSANGLCKVWNGSHFTLITQDLWEERLCFPDLEENFSYSLAACSAGLKAAHKIIPNQEWNKTAIEMKAVITKHNKISFSRSFGQLDDNRADASLLGLLWPFAVAGKDSKVFFRTLENIEQDITKKSGVYRYAHDEYDGWMHKGGIHRKKGAGYWPLLNFWMAIVQNKLGHPQKAKTYFDKVLVDLKKQKDPLNHIPEQIFDNNIQVAVKPLAWSHAMLVIAAHELKLID